MSRFILGLKNSKYFHFIYLNQMLILFKSNQAPRNFNKGMISYFSRLEKSKCLTRSLFDKIFNVLICPIDSNTSGLVHVF